MTQDQAVDFHPAKRLVAAITVNTCFLALEVVFGFVAGSLALLADAGHNFSDSFALVLSLVAVRMMSRPRSEEKTFGYQRMGVLAAFINSLLVVFVCFYLFYEAIQRFIEPAEVEGAAVIVVATLGVLVNGGMALLLWRGREDLNLKSAFLHLFTDAAVSLGVVVSGVVVLLTDWLYVDPLITMFIGLFIIVGAFQIIREAFHILMESVPRGVDYARIVADMSSRPGVTDVHDLHIWEIGSKQYLLSAHIVVDDCRLSDHAGLLRDIKEMLLSEHKVLHATLELETEPCPPGEECHL